MTTASQSWNLILNNYISLEENEWNATPMIDLVKHIKSKYSERLFGYTSLDRLFISIYPDIDRFVEALHVNYDRFAKEFCVSYYSRPNQLDKPEWERIYKSDIAIEKFDHFI